MASKVVSWIIQANYARARKEADKTADSLRRLRDEKAAVNKESIEGDREAEQVEKKRQKSIAGVTAELSKAAKAQEQANAATQRATPTTRALADAEDKVTAASIRRAQAGKALEAAEKRLSAIESKHGKDSEKYASALLSVERRTLDVEAANRRHSSTLSRLAQVQDEVNSAASRGDGIFRRLFSTIGGGSGRLSSFGGALRALRLPFLFVAIGVAVAQLIPLLSQLTAGAFALLGPLASLGGVLGALPQAFSIFGGVIGTLVAGLGGIGAALKAGTAAQKANTAATKSGAKAADQARQRAEALADAQYNLKQAHLAAADAQKRLTEARKQARKNIDDLKTSLRDLELQERGASIGLEEARNRLNEVMQDPGATDLDRRSAQLAYDQAVAQLDDVKKQQKDTQKDLKKSQDKGIEGADEVVQAKRAEADANHNVMLAERALADARRKEASATSEAAAAQQKYNEALADLSPAGQKFVKTLLGMRDEVKRLRAAAQEGLLPGLGKSLTILLKLMPLAEQGLRSFGQIIGNTAVQSAKLVTSPMFSGILQKLLKSNEKILRQAGQGAVNLLAALLHLANAARPFTEWLSTVVLGWTKYLRAQAKVGDESGRLEGFFKRLQGTLTSLGHIFGNLIKTFSNIAKAGSDLGGDMLRSFARITKGWANWTGSIKKGQGQNSLKEWFDAARPTLHEVSLLLGAITKGFFEFGKSNTVAPLLKQIREQLLPALGDIVRALQGDVSSAFIDLLSDLATLIANLVGGDGGSSALATFIKTLDLFVTVLNKIAGNSAGAAVIKALAFSLGTLAAIKFTSTITGLGALSKTLKKMGRGENLLGKVLGFTGKGEANKGIAKMLGKVGGTLKSGLGKVFSVSTGKKVVGGLAKGIGTGLRGLGRVVARGFARLAPIIGRALLTLGRVILAASPWLLLAAGLVVVIVLIVKHWNKIKEIFSKAINFVLDFIKKHWKFIALLAGPLGAVIVLIVKHWDKIKKVFTRVIGAIGDFIKKHWKDILLGLISPWGLVIKLVSGNWDKIVGVFKGIPDKIKKLARFFKDAGKVIIDALLSGLAKSGDFAKGFAKTIYDAIRKVVNFGIDKLNGLLEISVNTHIPGVGTVGINPTDIPHLPEAKFARGGQVPGYGNRDSVRAMLTPGEFVLRKDAVKAIGVSNLHALNEGRKRRRYARGGYVDEPVHFANGGSVIRRKRRRRPGEGVLGDTDVQFFHKGGPVLGMKAGAKGDWVKALEALEHVKQDGTWDKMLDALLRRNGTSLYKRDKTLDMPETKDQSLIAWLLGAKVKSVPQTHRVVKGETSRQILKTFYGSATQDQLKALLNLNHLGQAKREVSTPGGAGRALSKAISFAKGQSGKPYIWGGVGPRGYDCSGYQSAIINVIKGKNPYHRLFATATEGSALPRLGFKPGMGDSNDFSIGWYTGNPGHTAGTLGNFNVESTGNHVRNGSAARGARDFSRKMHLSLEGGKGGTKVVISGKKYTLDTKLPTGKVLKLPSGSTAGSRSWVDTAKHFKVSYETLYGWAHGIYDRLKQAVPPEKMTNFLRGYNSWGVHEGTIFDALNKKMNVPAVPPKTFTTDSQKALTHVLAHAYGRPHGDLSYRPWQAFSPVEAALQQQLNHNERERQFEAALNQLASWGYDSLVDDLVSKGVDDDAAFNTAIDAAKKQDLARQLNDAIAKGSSGMGQDDLKMILDLIAFLSKSKGFVGLRQMARFLGLSDYEAVKLFEKARDTGRLVNVPNTAGIAADIVAYRNGTFYANTGGMVPGSGNGDTVPAMLTPGEFVIKKKAARALGLSNLLALNNVQKFAKGGLVMAPAVSKIPTNASSGGMSVNRLVGAGSVVNNTQITYDVDIINPVAEPSTQSLTKMLQRRGAMSRMGSVKNDE